ncbi:MAG: glycosyltransferase family 2 protein [Candidatus Electrothrix sp. AW5]|nr:glycosyltransferase family 2 protein [Candidatus Electrothrix gigas]
MGYSVQQSPRVSVIIPAVGRVKLLERAISSVFRQSVPIEVIVIDDASTLPLEHSLSLTSLNRIRLLRNKIRMNAAYSRNLGVKHATANIVAFLDSDDEWLPEHLSITLEKTDFSKSCIYITPLKNTDEGGKCIHNAYNYLFGGGGDFRTSGLVCSKSAFNLAGGFDIALNKHQDWDFTLRSSNYCCLYLGKLATVKINTTAPSRMSYRPNLDASKRFFDKHQKRMNLTQRCVFFSGIIRSCVYSKKNMKINQAKYWILSENIKPSNFDPVTQICWHFPLLGMSLLRLRQLSRIVF